MLGATSFAVLADYADRLNAVGGRLYLSGVDEVTHRQLRNNRAVDRTGVVEVFESTATVGESSLEAYRAAEAWVAGEQ